ncbi:MAG: T9SS type A sorting domain-containing protein [Bacteroidia bacterium]
MKHKIILTAVLFLIGFNVNGQHLRGLLQDTATDEWKFVSMDVQTEVVTELSAIKSLKTPFGTPGLVNRSSNTYYIYGNDTANQRQLWAISLIDGSLIDIVPIPNVYALTMNAEDDFLYGFRVSGSNSQTIRLNPANGQATVFTGINFPSQVGSFYPEGITVHGAAERLYIPGETPSPGRVDKFFEYTLQGNGSYKTRYDWAARVLRTHIYNDSVYVAHVIGGKTQFIGFIPDSLPAIHVIVDSLPLQSTAGNPGFNSVIDPDAHIYYHYGIKSLSPYQRLLLMIDLNNGQVLDELEIGDMKAIAGTIHPPSVKLNRINGSIFYDRNGNGVKDNNDGPLINQSLLVQPGNFYVYSNRQGNFSLPVGPGTYKLSVVANGPFALTTSPPEYNVTFTGNGEDTSGVDFGLEATGASADGATVTLDVQDAATYHLNTRLNHYITYKNSGNTDLDGTVTYHLDTLFDYVSATPAPDAINDNEYSFDFSDMYPSEERQILLVLENSIDQSTIGKTACTVANMDFGSSGGSSNLYDTTCQVIVASWDPNDKLHETSQEAVIEAGSRLTYKVRFQNTGNAPAFNIVIRDTLDMLLKPSTFEMISASHDYNVYINDNEIVWEFMNIMLPDSGSDWVGSNGFVKFSVEVDSSANKGDFIYNQAGIFFDLNPPVITNEVEVQIPLEQSVDRVDKADGIKLYPNPSTGVVTVELPVAASQAIFILYDLYGRKIQQTNYGQVKVVSQDFGSLKNGIYIIEVATEQMTYISKWIKGE